MKKYPQAEAPRGWSKKVQCGKNGLVTLYSLFRKAGARARKVGVPTLAGSLAFTTVLSIAPLLAVMFYVFMLFGGLDYAYDKLLPFLLDNLSEGSGAVVEEHLEAFIRQVHAHAVGWIGIAGLLLTSLATYFNIVGTFNRIWEVDHPRSFQHRILRAMTLLTLGPILLTGSIAMTTAVATHLKIVPFSGALMAYGLSTMLFAMLYGLVPMVKVPLKVIALGALLPAALWEIAKFLYTIYTHRMVAYSNFYGAFAAIPLFLLWVYIAWCIMLFGAVWVRTLQLHFEEKGTL